jgi:hypothetical protein
MHSDMCISPPPTSLVKHDNLSRLNRNNGVNVNVTKLGLLMTFLGDPNPSATIVRTSSARPLSRKKRTHMHYESMYMAEHLFVWNRLTNGSVPSAEQRVRSLDYPNMVTSISTMTRSKMRCH